MDWKAKTRKRMFSGYNNEEIKDRNRLTGDEGRPKRANRGIMNDVPCGFVPGDGVLVRDDDSGKEISLALWVASTAIGSALARMAWNGAEERKFSGCTQRDLP